MLAPELGSGVSCQPEPEPPSYSYDRCHVRLEILRANFGPALSAPDLDCSLNCQKFLLTTSVTFKPSDRSKQPEKFDQSSTMTDHRARNLGHRVKEIPLQGGFDPGVAFVVDWRRPSDDPGNRLCQ